MDNHTPYYEPDDGPLTAEHIAFIQQHANVPQNINWGPSLLDMSEEEYRAYAKKHHTGINGYLTKD